ncbi:hypothetical protein CU044_5513 [Streptomyces sp. L-9-10]|nr:hypothetical protein CU044_5513 [Streptomyces sp. L-9-10]
MSRQGFISPELAPTAPTNGSRVRTRAPGHDGSRFDRSQTRGVPDPFQHGPERVHRSVLPPRARRPVRRHQPLGGLHGIGVRVTESSPRVLPRLRAVRGDILDRLKYYCPVHARLHGQSHLETRHPLFAVLFPRRVHCPVLLRHVPSRVIGSSLSRSWTAGHRRRLHKRGN